MKTNETLKILVADPSPIVRAGVIALCRHTMRKGIQPFEAASSKEMEQVLCRQNPDILLVNPNYWGTVNYAKIQDANVANNAKKIALVYAPVDETILKQFDETISIFDTEEQIAQKIAQLLEIKQVKEAPATPEPVSQREKEIIACVAKGMTNKDIAEKFFLSLHTVITHRRNIARKLEVRSVAGLTIYAIVNKLVTLDEIKVD
jgi:DNA-binding NarL/FixJ family response regulator